MQAVSDRVFKRALVFTVEYSAILVVRSHHHRADSGGYPVFED